MRCVVTGGAGFIGKHLLVRLLSGNVERVCVVDNLSRSTWNDADTDRLHFVSGDIRNLDQLETVMQGCDVVFHLAGAATVMGCEAAPEQAHAANVTGTCNVLEAAKRCRVQRIVFASSREVYGEPLQLPVAEHAPLKPKNAYGASKSAAEMYCSWYASTAIEVTTLRLANVFGIGDSGRVIPIFLEKASAGKPITVYGGAQIIDFVPVRVVVDALVRAAFGPYVNGCVNVGSGVGTSLLETAKRIREHCGSASDIAIAPARPAEVRRFIADTARARSELRLDLPNDPLSEIGAVAPSVASAGNGESAHVLVS